MKPDAYLFHADGSLPNFALMRLSTWLKSQGYEVRLVRSGERRTLFDKPALLYGSSIFRFSAKTRAAIEREWGAITWGGTGTWIYDGLRVVSMGPALEDLAPGIDFDSIAPDYSLYPEFTNSIGFLQRGCRLTCGFCVVPKKEGKPRSVRDVAGIWRGDPFQKNLVILDNDPFGNPEWRERFEEIRTGGFRVCISQGMNTRMINEESARALASIEYRNTKFSRRRLYTAWDNLGDESVFKDGVKTLEANGIPGRHLMVFMLVGYAKAETMEQILYRFHELVALGCLPYPMVFEKERANVCKACKPLTNRTEPCTACRGDPDPEVRRHVKRLLGLARWASTGLYRAVPWEKYDVRIKTKKT